MSKGVENDPAGRYTLIACVEKIKSRRWYAVRMAGSKSRLALPIRKLQIVDVDVGLEVLERVHNLCMKLSMRTLFNRRPRG